MPINVNAAICSDTAEIVTVERSTAGSYDADGLWQPGTTSTFKSLCSVQQPTPDELLILPAGERDKDIRVFYSIKQLRTLSDRMPQNAADVLIYKGARYRIINLGDWQSYGYSRAIAARVEDGN